MEHRAFGKTDLRVAPLALGTMQFGWTADEAQSFAVLDAYVDAGGNLLDSADIYSRWVSGHRGGESEEVVGRWLAKGGKRNDVLVATKVRGQMWDGPDGEGLSRSHILRAAEDSLRRLQVETIDLYQCHWFDEKTPVEETLRAFEELIASGKVRYIGASNHPPPQLREALDTAASLGTPGFVSLQPHHNMVHRQEYEVDLQEICTERGLAVIPYSPLAGGFLTGKYDRESKDLDSARAGKVRQFFNDAGWATVDTLRDIAGEHGVKPAAVALAWSLTRPGVVAPIVGANSPEQLKDQLPAAELQLTNEQVQRLDRASEPYLRGG